jgi:transposase
MRQKSGPEKQPAEDAIRAIRRATRRHFSAEEKIRIILEGLRGEESIAEVCRREGIASSMYYGWSKEFLEAGKRRLAGDTARRDFRRGEGSPPRSASVGGGRGRSHARKPTLGAASNPSMHPCRSVPTLVETEPRICRGGRLSL